MKTNWEMNLSAWLLKILPPHISAKILLAFVIGTFIWKKLTQELVGIFIVSCFIYIYFHKVSHPKPFTPNELIVFIDNLDREFQVVLYSTVIALLGFFVTLYSATISWKQKLQVDINLKASSELSVNFNKIQKVYIDMSLYAKSLLRCIDSAQKEPNTWKSDFEIEYNLEKSSKYIENRDMLLSLFNELNDISISHHHEISNIPFGNKQIKKAIDKTNEILSDSYFTIPLMKTDHANLSDEFLSKVNKSQIDTFVNNSKINIDLARRNIHSITGILKAKIWDLTVFSLVDIIKNRKTLKDHIKATIYD